MIAIRKLSGHYTPVILCDECGGVITDALAASVVLSSAPEGATAQAFYVHKGACDDALCARLGGLHGSEELAVHLIQIVQGALAASDPQRLRTLSDWLSKRPPRSTDTER